MSAVFDDVTNCDAGFDLRMSPGVDQRPSYSRRMRREGLRANIAKLPELVRKD